MEKRHLFLSRCTSRSSPSWFNSSWWASFVNRTDLVWIRTGLVWIRTGLLLNLFRESEEAQPEIGLAWLVFCQDMIRKRENKKRRKEEKRKCKTRSKNQRRSWKRSRRQCSRRLSYRLHRPCVYFFLFWSVHSLFTFCLWCRVV